MQKEVNEWNKKNETLINQIVEFLKPILKNPDRLSLSDYFAPFLYFGNDQDMFVFHANETSTGVFLVPLDEFDQDDWKDELGSSFRNRVAFTLSKDWRKGQWYQASVWDLCKIVRDDVGTYHPSFSFSVFSEPQGGAKDEPSLTNVD